MTNNEAQDVKTQDTVVPEANLQTENQNQDSSDNQNVNEIAKGSKEYNWRQMEKKNEELEHQLKELLRREEEKNKPIPQQEEDELSSLSDDDIITAAQARKLAQKQAEELIKKAFTQKEFNALPEKARNKFNDFDAIMTKENIQKLENEEPDLADACSKASNPWEATYKILKKVIVPITETKSQKSEEKLNENLSKPLSSHSVGRQGPLSNANAWAEASKEDLYKEMISAARKG